MRNIWIIASALVGGLGGGTAESASQGSGQAIAVTASPVRYPDVAYDAQNNVFLAVTGNNVTQGHFISPSGTLLPGPFGSGRFNVTSTTDYQHAVRAHCAAGVCLLVWHQGSPVVPMARVISYSAGFVSQPIAIGPQGSAWEFGAGISFSTATNEFLVTWMGDYPAANNIYMARLNVAGQLLQTTPVTTGADYERQPSVAYNPASDEFIVAYAGTRYISGVETGYIRTQRVKNNALLGGATEIALGGATYIPVAEYNVARQSVAVAWVQGARTYAREIFADGSVGALATLSSTYGSYDALDLAYNPQTSSFLVVSHGSTAEDIAYEVSPTLVPSAPFTATSSGGSGNYNPQLASSTVEGKWLIGTSRDFAALWIQLVLGSGSTPPPPAALTVSSLTANKAFPLTLGESVTFTATATGGTPPYTYKFVTYNQATGWTVTQDYSSSNQLTYFPNAGTNAVQVWVRNAGSSASYDAYLSSGLFTVNASTPAITSFTANKTFPQPVNTLVTFTATVAGGISPQYQFWKYNSSTGWSLAQNYSGTNTFTYYPEAGTNAVQVWVRNTGSSNSYDTYASSGYFTITAAAPLVVTSLTANTNFPQPVNTQVTFTATATGGTSPLQYLFWTYNSNTGWQITQNWGSSNILTYFPAAGNNAVQVWVRNNGSSTTYDAYLSSGVFTITSLGAPTSVTLTAYDAFPVPLNTLVDFTASATGGTNVEYQFWTYNSTTGWTVTQAYGPLATFAYYPAAGTNAVQVWVRNGGATASWEAWGSSGYFTVTP